MCVTEKRGEAFVFACLYVHACLLAYVYVRASVFVLVCVRVCGGGIIVRILKLSLEVGCKVDQQLCLLNCFSRYGLVEFGGVASWSEPGKFFQLHWV
jgi:hypothetical protein